MRFFRPLVINIQTHVVDDYDGLFIVWVVIKHIQNFSTNFSALFDGGIFYPVRHTLLFSEPFFFSSLFSAPLYLARLESIVVYNFLIIAGYFLTSFIIFLWLFDMSRNYLASFFGAVLFATSSIYLVFMHHVQVFSLFIFVLASWMIWKFVEKEEIKYLYFFCFLSVLQIWESLLPAAWLVFFAFFLLKKKVSIFIKYKKQIIVSLFFVLLATFPLIMGYLEVSSYHDVRRTIRDSAHFSLSLNELWGVYFSPFVYILFFVISFWALRKKKFLSPFFGMAILSLIMSLGPVLKWHGQTVRVFGDYFIPLPYGVFYYVLPFFRVFRTPSRWIIPFALFASIFIALWIARYKSKQVDALLIFIIFVALLVSPRLPVLKQIPQKDSYPKVYKWLARQEGGVVLEMPIYTWASEEGKKEVYRMLYSLEHRKKLVNGYSGFYPPEWEKFVREANNFPKDRFNSLVSSRGVDYIIFHKDEYEGNKLLETTSYLESSDIYKKDYEDEEVIVFRNASAKSDY